MRNFLTRGVLVVLLGFMYACANDPSNDDDADISSVTVVTAIDFFDDLDFKSGLETSLEDNTYGEDSIVGEDSLVLKSAYPLCANILVETTEGGFPKIFTLQFDSQCFINGINREGTLTITLSDTLLRTGSQMTIERGEDYFINDVKLEGTLFYTNTTTDPDTPSWTRTISDGEVTLTNGISFSHSGVRTITFIEGYGNFDVSDDVYQIDSGTHTVIRPSGATFVVTVIEPLIKKYTCQYISQGILNIVGPLINGDIDYGDDTCDDDAVYIHEDGEEFDIEL